MPNLNLYGTHSNNQTTLAEKILAHMALTCNFIAPNGEPYDLSVALEQQFGAEQTTEVMRVLHTQKAFDIFNWVENTEFNSAKGEINHCAKSEVYLIKIL